MQEQKNTAIDPISEENCKNASRYQKLPILSKNLWTAFITVFISGIIIGAASIQLFMDRKIKRYFLPEHIKMRILARMTDELNLSIKQRRDADKIITDMTRRIAVIRRSQAPEIQRIVKSSFKDISELLNEEQKQKFIKLQKRIESCQSRTRGMITRGAGQPQHCKIMQNKTPVRTNTQYNRNQIQHGGNDAETQ